ncbi:MAG: hypothetical protein QOE73_281 [Verrucomicrobiota bacterium]|jgi:hypothetical protein|nr:hypothetical protein [Blastocatellia bacterium]
MFLFSFFSVARSRDPTSQRLQPIQSARAEYDLRAVFREQNRSRLAYSAEDQIDSRRVSLERTACHRRRRKVLCINR